MYRNALDPYGLSYEPNLGWDSPEVTSTANALFAAQPSRFPRWELNALAGGEQAKAGLFGKALGVLGLDESGNRAGTSWTDAAKHTASNVINAPQDIANQLLALKEYQPVYGTAGDAEDRALAGRQAGEVFGLAGLAPVAAAGVSRATRASGMPQKFEPGWHPDVYYHGTTKDFERFASPEELAKRDPVWRDPSMSHQKHHFTVWPDAASQYAMENGVDGARVIPVRLRSDVPTTQMGAWAATDTPGTVKSAITGETLFSNPKEASLPALMSQSREGQGIRAYHGSPHDFDRFSMDKIGTGEGAQAYGHGLYFAENEGVAKQYRDTVRNQWSSLDPEAKPGHMYEVRINAAPEDFLDWDKPLSQQSEKVRALLEHPAVKKQTEFFGDPNGERLTGKSAYGAVAKWNTAGDQRMGSGDPSALRDAGIPGIRYLDQGSRGAGEGSRNLVVFDDKIIDIIRKYGWAAAAPLIAAYQSDGAQANALAGR